MSFYCTLPCTSTCSEGAKWYVGILWGVWPWAMSRADDSPLFSQLPHRQAVKHTIKPGGDTTLSRLINHTVMSPHTLPTRSYLPHSHTQHERRLDTCPRRIGLYTGAAFELFLLASHTFAIMICRAVRQLLPALTRRFEAIKKKKGSYFFIIFPICR